MLGVISRAQRQKDYDQGNKGNLDVANLKNEALETLIYVTEQQLGYSLQKNWTQAVGHLTGDKGWKVEPACKESSECTDRLITRLLSAPRSDTYASRKHQNYIKELDLKEANLLWVSDITYIPIDGQVLYLHLVTDAYSRRIMGAELDSYPACRT